MGTIGGLLTGAAGFGTATAWPAARCASPSPAAQAGGAGCQTAAAAPTAQAPALQAHAGMSLQTQMHRGLITGQRCAERTRAGSGAC